MKPLCLARFLLVVLFISGCQGGGESIKVRIQHAGSADDSTSSPLTVEVSPFNDRRPSSEHLGLRTLAGGGKRYFDVLDGTLSQRMTSSFVDFLNQAGFSASTANGTGSADVRIEGAIQKFAVQATDEALSTLLEVDAVMAFKVHNAVDKSTIRVAVGVGETDNTVFFTAKDMEKLIGEVLAEGFEEFLEQTEAQGQALKFRFLGESS